MSKGEIFTALLFLSLITTLALILILFGATLILGVIGIEIALIDNLLKLVIGFFILLIGIILLIAFISILRD